MTVHTVDMELGGRPFSIETGKMAKQASGAVLVQYCDTTVLVAAVGAKMSRDLPFFPLTIDYRERTSAAGKFPGGFFKREGRPTTKEIITMRLIDRPTRPLFPKLKGIEVQVQCMVLSADQEIDPDIVAMNGASAAVSLSDMPFGGPWGAVRIGRSGEELIVNPTIQQLADSDLDLVVAGTADAITMVEAGAKEVPEDVVLDALFLAHDNIKELVALQADLVKRAGKEKWDPPEETATYKKLHDGATKAFYKKMRKAVVGKTKDDRRGAIKELKESYVEKYGPDPKTGEDRHDPAEVSDVWSSIEKRAVRDVVVEDSKRIDGRDLTEVRDIECEVNILPRTHGSSLFTRGETQSLVTVTLGTTRDEQKIDGLREPISQSFMLHYNFPPFCVGECRPIRGPGRREIGHGQLAERALAPIMPGPWDFPYTVRIVSDILESNGSSSMASVCGGSLAMMDAGVPIKAPVAGIAMGLIKEGKEIRVLSDILGDEDHCGDMDFKLAGTEAGITAMQLDCKVAGIDRKIMEKALHQARDGRLHILKEMGRALDKSRKDVSIFAPRAFKIPIDPDKIGLVVGGGGRTIKQIQAETGAQIEISDDGTVAIYSADKAGAESAKERVEQIVQEPEIGRVYQGRVTAIKPFGAFVEFLPSQEGLVHVSELADEYVSNVRDVVNEGDVIAVKILAVDDQDRVKLSRKAALQEMATSPQSEEAEAEGSWA